MHPEQKKIVERIIGELERGVIPWRQQFKVSRSQTGLPYNAISGRPYSGFNVMVLLMTGRPIDGGWLTYKQAQLAGGNVKKGERSTVIFYYSKLKSKEKTEKGEDKFFMLAKSYLVFHISQCERIDASKLHQFPPAQSTPIDPQTLRHLEADAFVAATGATVITEVRKNASYYPFTDKIHINDIRDYFSVDAYYSTLFHELIHWTGKRLGRTMNTNKATQAYGYEELIAELGACFTLPQFGFNNEANNSAYLGAWINILKETPNALMQVASKATQANAFLNAFSVPVEVESDGDDDISQAA